MGWTINGYVPDEPKARLIPSTKKESNIPVSSGWAAARQEQLNAQTSGQQLAPNVPSQVAPQVGQKHGPAFRGGPNDVWSPQGFGVTGLKDVFGMPLPTPGLPRPSQPTDERTSTNGNGVTQTMKAMSSTSTPIDMNRSFNDLLAAQNNQRYTGFNSSQLPETVGNPFSATAPKTDSFNPLAPGITGGSLADFGGDGSAAFAQSRERTANDTFNPDAARIEGASERPKGGRLDAALADKAGINSYMEKFSSGDRERAANRAFLDTEKSMEALRAKEAVNGVVYAGGQHYVSGKSGDDPAVAINRSAARDISNGTETASGASQKAQDFLQKKTAETVAAVKQSPTLLEDGAKDGAFQQDKPMFSGNTPAIGGAVEFDNNNDQTLPTFGAPKGYKSQSTYKDPSFPNPFG